MSTEMEAEEMDTATVAFMCDTYRQSKFSTTENYSLVNIMHEVLATVRAIDPMTKAALNMLEALKAAKDEIEMLWKETGRTPTSPASRPWDTVITKATEGK